MEPIKILMIEDNPGDARLIQDMLAEAQNIEFVIDWRQTLTSGLDSLSTNKPDAILLDLGLPDSPQRSMSFTRIQAAAPNMPIVILTGLDDETFAVTSVRRGVQDYLVKGKINTDTLVRTIRYAIARKLGGDKQFSITELNQYDGKEGKQAYFAYKGKVYDASNSRLWKGGKHTSAHVAGTDLTEALSKAPHAEDILARLPIVGYLAKEQTLGQKFLKRVDSFHLHTTLVHVSITCTFLTPFSFIGWILNGGDTFDDVTLFLLIVGLITVPLSLLTGVISWIINYETKSSRSFNMKYFFGILLLITLVGSFLLRITSSDWISSNIGQNYFLGILFIQCGLSLATDFYGKKIVYS